MATMIAVTKRLVILAVLNAHDVAETLELHPLRAKLRNQFINPAHFLRLSFWDCLSSVAMAFR